MISKVLSAATLGYDGQIIRIECDSSNGLPGLIIVGLGNKAIEESKERIRSAIKNSKLDFPRKRVTLNLAPADIPKVGSHYDFPMALAILAINSQLPVSTLANTLFVGELALDGSLRPISGIIGHLQTAKAIGIPRAIIPHDNLNQGQLIEGIDIYGAKTLKEAFLFLTRNQSLTKGNVVKLAGVIPKGAVKLNDIYGQQQAKRALVIAAAGHHNLLLHGPPGSGKTMLAKTLVSLLPPPCEEEIIAITKLHSLAGELKEDVLLSRPLRSPHHTSSHIAIIGGGQSPKPGEISLAHHGVLFLDELPEYPRIALEALRQPLEDRQVSIARAQGRFTYPADFILVATQNPCPCGYYGDTTKECICTPQQVSQYTKRISGPLLDRIDLVVKVNRVEQSALFQAVYGREPPNPFQSIMNARLIQHTRLGSKLLTNAHLTQRDIVEKAGLTPKAKAFLDRAAQKLDLSARSYIKVIRVARTIADLEANDILGETHISEALQYRQH